MPLFPPSFSSLTTLAFGGACAYSLYAYFSALAASSAAAADVAKARTFSDAELIALLTAVESRARRITGETEAALRLARSEASGVAGAAGGASAGAGSAGAADASLEQVARARVQAELAAAQADVCSAAGFSERDVALALTLAQEREGGERAGAVTAAATRVRQVAGKWFLTKRSVLETMTGTFQLQAVLMQELVEEALTTKQVTGVKSLQRFLGLPRVSKRVQDAMHAYTLQKTGLSVMELDEFTRKPAFTEVRMAAGTRDPPRSPHTRHALTHSHSTSCYPTAGSRFCRRDCARSRAGERVAAEQTRRTAPNGHANDGRRALMKK